MYLDLETSWLNLKRGWKEKKNFDQVRVDPVAIHHCTSDLFFYFGRSQLYVILVCLSLSTTTTTNPISYWMESNQMDVDTLDEHEPGARRGQRRRAQS